MRDELASKCGAPGGRGRASGVGRVVWRVFGRGVARRVFGRGAAQTSFAVVGVRRPADARAGSVADLPRTGEASHKGPLITHCTYRDETRFVVDEQPPRDAAAFHEAGARARPRVLEQVPELARPCDGRVGARMLPRGPAKEQSRPTVAKAPGGRNGAQRFQRRPTVAKASRLPDAASRGRPRRRRRLDRQVRKTPNRA